MQGGEIFVPKIPSVLITDLAKALAPGIKQKLLVYGRVKKFMKQCLLLTSPILSLNLKIYVIKPSINITKNKIDYKK